MSFIEEPDIELGPEERIERERERARAVQRMADLFGWLKVWFGGLLVCAVLMSSFSPECEWDTQCHGNATCSNFVCDCPADVQRRYRCYEPFVMTGVVDGDTYMVMASFKIAIERRDVVFQALRFWIDWTFWFPMFVDLVSSVIHALFRCVVGPRTENPTTELEKRANDIHDTARWIATLLLIPPVAMWTVDSVPATLRVVFNCVAFAYVVYAWVRIVHSWVRIVYACVRGVRCVHVVHRENEIVTIKEPLLGPESS